MAVRIAEEWFATCGGCEVTILDIGEPLLDLLAQVQIVHMPVLMDHKLFGQAGEKAEMEIPDAEVGMISGGIRSEEHVKLAEEMRRRCNTLIALGSCACYGGIPALANLSTTGEILDRSYRQSISTDPGDTPTEDVPPLTDRVYAIREVVPVDVLLPGCPTTPEMVATALLALLEGRTLAPVTKSVCDECPLIREKKAVPELKRTLEKPAFTPGRPLNEMRCFMEQGFLCLGPATRAGCGGAQGIARCIRAYVPCEGCFGPLSEQANPMVDMLGALSTVGVDPRRIPDRAATFNRFAGAGRLRPATLPRS
jgi:F420-non-reducing hydrogenase small subunit